MRVVLPLRWEQRLIGVWLLGRRDPEDLYSQADLAMLTTLAHQTAIALMNIFQAESLHALYRADIERNEDQRSHLARELHDTVLNELASFAVDADGPAPADFPARIGRLTAQLRQIIAGLRPATLAYGLGVALSSLADDLTAQAAGGAGVEVELESDDVPLYPPAVEQQLYRIVQQALENALRHARPRTVRVTGRLAADEIDLTVADDGTGFAAPGPLDLDKLVAQKHYGLAGMFERAAIVGAQLRLESAAGQGTRVHVHWRAPAEPGADGH